MPAYIISRYPSKTRTTGTYQSKVRIPWQFVPLATRELQLAQPTGTPYSHPISLSLRMLSAHAGSRIALKAFLSMARQYGLSFETLRRRSSLAPSRRFPSASQLANFLSLITGVSSRSPSLILAPVRVRARVEWSWLSPMKLVYSACALSAFPWTSISTSGADPRYLRLSRCWSSCATIGFEPAKHTH